jgi:hypothetical protein
MKKIEDIEMIQKKKFINVKEFALIFNISNRTQANFRGRIHNSLPYIQTTRRGNITYQMEQVENWFKNHSK